MNKTIFNLHIHVSKLYYHSLNKSTIAAKTIINKNLRSHNGELIFQTQCIHKAFKSETYLRIIIM
jgi:hypothetical protein